MNLLKHHINELKAAEAFTRQAVIFDELYENDPVIQYKRARVRKHMLQYLQPGSTLLELNCGTGVDAVYFAEAGFEVHATDISTGMLRMMEEKVSKSQSAKRISMEQCSFTELDMLTRKGPYDHVYSNFGGLNCTGEIHKVLQSFNDLLKPGGVVTLVIISPFCIWETLLLFKGRFRTAFRRFFSTGGRKASVEGVGFNCWYYHSSYVRKQLGKKFELLSLEGLCTLVPPSYIAQFGVRHPRLFSFLRSWEDTLKTKWPWKNTGDYYIISFRKSS